MESLVDRVIAVAGAGGNLGPTVVRRLASAQATLELGSRDKAPLDALSADLEIEADNASVDLLDPGSARSWVDAIVARHGRVDGLVHLVGGWRGGKPIEEAPLEDWDILHGLLIRTVQHTTPGIRAAARGERRGRFVLVSSSQAQAPTHTNAAYAAAKAGAEAWTLALADRFRGSGATANIVVVGAIVTPAMREETPDKDFSTFTSAEEIAEAVAYLCSGEAASMNGQRITLRGAV